MLDLASSGDWDSSVACIGRHKLQIGSGQHVDHVMCLCQAA